MPDPATINPPQGGTGAVHPKPLAFAKPTFESLQNRFRHHAPEGDQADRYGQIREKILQAAAFCVERTPCSAEQTRAINALDEAMFLFNAAIARNE